MYTYMCIYIYSPHTYICIHDRARAARRPSSRSPSGWRVGTRRDIHLLYLHTYPTINNIYIPQRPAPASSPPPRSSAPSSAPTPWPSSSRCRAPGTRMARKGRVRSVFRIFGVHMCGCLWPTTYTQIYTPGRTSTAPRRLPARGQRAQGLGGLCPGQGPRGAAGESGGRLPVGRVFGLCFACA